MMNYDADRKLPVLTTGKDKQVSTQKQNRSRSRSFDILRVKDIYLKEAN